MASNVRSFIISYGDFVKRAKVFWALGIFVTALVIFSGYVLYRVANNESRHDWVKVEMMALTMKINAYRLDTGILPKTLQGLLLDDGVPSWNGPYAKSGDLLDPWGRAHHYEVVDSTKHQFSLLDVDAKGTVVKSMTSEP